MFEPVLLKNVYVPDGHLLATYEAGGGYRALEKALKEYTPDDIIELIKRSNLRGRGGAGREKRGAGHEMIEQRFQHERLEVGPGHARGGAHRNEVASVKYAFDHSAIEQGVRQRRRLRRRDVSPLVP